MFFLPCASPAFLSRTLENGQFRYLTTVFGLSFFFGGAAAALVSGMVFGVRNVKVLIDDERWCCWVKENLGCKLPPHHVAH